jgi:hydroxymethylglutaryl-CoA lyase
MLHLGSYLHGDGNDSKCATTLAVHGTRRDLLTEYGITINDEEGAQFAVINGLNSASLVISVSETMNAHLFGLSRTETFRQLIPAIGVLKSGGVVSDLQLSAVFGCPFEGRANDAMVLQLVDYFCLLGIEGVTLRDSSGAASPAETAALCRRIVQLYPHLTVTLHLNDATGLAAQITRAAADEGIVRFGLTGRELALPGNMNMDLHIGTSLRYIAEVESYGFNTGINAENLSQIMQFGSVNI